MLVPSVWNPLQTGPLSGYNTILREHVCPIPKIFFFFNFYCYSITVVCIFSPSLHPTPAEPTSLPHLHPPPWFCPCVLYSSSCNILSFNGQENWGLGEGGVEWTYWCSEAFIFAQWPWHHLQRSNIHQKPHNRNRCNWTLYTSSNLKQITQLLSNFLFSTKNWLAVEEIKLLGHTH